MGAVFSLQILAADRVFFDGEAESLIVPAFDGLYQILAHHENMVLATKEGLITYRAAGETEGKIAVVGIGFVHVRQNTVTMLVDTAERPEDIDRVRAEAAMQRAQEQLRQDQSIQEYQVSMASLARAMARLSSPNSTMNQK